MEKLQGSHAWALITNPNLDQATRDQIKTFLDQPQFSGGRIVIMPDAHAGKGSCVGFTMSGAQAVMPAIVGVDIGCGVLGVRIDPDSPLDYKALDQLIRERIPSGHRIHEKLLDTLEVSESRRDLDDACRLFNYPVEKMLQSLGTLGGGNHFIEVGRDSQGFYWILIHTGSRNFGKHIADRALDACYQVLQSYHWDGPKDLAFAPVDTRAWYEYRIGLDAAQTFAKRNRHMILRIIVGALGLENALEGWVESVHNYIDDAGTIRKGAISAKLGEACLIPFSMADGTAMCVGKGNKEWNESAPHGAGRILSRSQARRQLSLDEFQAQMEAAGVYSTSVSMETLDEAPRAYKSKDEILPLLAPTVEVVDWIRPEYNFKAAR